MLEINNSDREYGHGNELEYFQNWFSVFCRRATKETKAFQRSSSCTETMKMVLTKIPGNIRESILKIRQSRQRYDH